MCDSDLPSTFVLVPILLVASLTATLLLSDLLLGVKDLPLKLVWDVLHQDDLVSSD